MGRTTILHRLGQIKAKKVFLSFVLVNIALYYVLLYLPFAGGLLRGSEREDWEDFVLDYRQRFDRHPPKGLDRWLRYAERNQCETRRHYEFLDVDLDFFRRRIDPDRNRFLDRDRVIPEGKTITDFYIAFSLEDHQLTMEEYHGKGWGFQWNRFQWMYAEHLLRNLLEPIRLHRPPLTTKFIINLYDKARDGSVNATYPLFSFCKEDYYTDDKPIPSQDNNLPPLSIDYHKGSNPHRFVASRDLLIPAKSSLQPPRHDMWFWPFYGLGRPLSKRRDAVNWRGSTTGEWDQGPRFQLVREYGGRDVHPLQFPNGSAIGVDADFAFARTAQKPIDADSPEAAYRFTQHMQYSQLQHYKYILDVDGNGFTGRFPGLLRSGSLIFKSSRYREWFHGVLEPYRHYIPVNYDYSDLVEKLAWVRANPKIAERIMKEGRTRAELRLRRNDIMCYTYRLILEYQALFEP